MTKTPPKKLSAKQAQHGATVMPFPAGNERKSRRGGARASDCRCSCAGQRRGWRGRSRAG